MALMLLLLVVVLLLLFNVIFQDLKFRYLSLFFIFFSALEFLAFSLFCCLRKSPKRAKCGSAILSFGFNLVTFKLFVCALLSFNCAGGERWAVQMLALSPRAEKRFPTCC